MGDPGKLLLLEAIIETIKKEDLFKVVNETGAILLNGLKEIEKETSGQIDSVRGRGVIVAFNLKCMKTRDQFLLKLKQKGYFKFPYIII